MLLMGDGSKSKASQKMSTTECNETIAALERSLAVIEFDKNGIILSANENYLNIFEYSLGEIVGKYYRMLSDRRDVDSSNNLLFWQNLDRGEPLSGVFKRVKKR